MKTLIYMTLLVLFLLQSCSRLPVSPEKSLRKISKTTNFKDDLNLKDIKLSINNTIESLEANPDKKVTIIDEVFTQKELSDSLKILLTCASTIDQLNTAISRYFQPLEVFGKKRWGEILMTSYYEPVLKGSLHPTKRLNMPIYSPPKNLVEVKLSSFLPENFNINDPGRTKISAQIITKNSGQSSIIPLPSREEIDFKQALKGKKLEIAYADPIDVFFLHIQGSGLVSLSDGKELRLGYAAQNGMKYEAIGKFMKDVIPPEKMSMQSIEDALRAGGDKYQQEIFSKNPSYVFFKVLKGRSLTTIGAEVTDKRSVAVDPLYFPLGIFGHVSYPDPDTPPEETPRSDLFKNSHFIITQDTGGAIKGPGRADLFWGKGELAKEKAGKMRHPAKLILFAPKKMAKEIKTTDLNKACLE